MPELDSLRGVAILLVLFYHGYFWGYGVTGLHGLAKMFVEATRPGWLGVNLFFVLSGFLITGILLESKSSANYYRRFYTRRALRILPAYYALLLLLFLAGSPRSFLALSFFYLANMAPLFGVTQGYGVLWSLAVEEQFYIFWPSVVRRVPVQALERFALCSIFVVPALRALSFLLGHTEGLSGYTWFVADGLAMGAWLAIYVRKPQFTRQRLLWVSVGAVGLAAAATFAFARFGLLTRERVLGAAFQESCGNLGFLGVLGFVLFLGTSRWKYLVQWSVLKFYGDISYGLYLIHMLMFTLTSRVMKVLEPGLATRLGDFQIITLHFVTGMSLATGLALLSRRYFEEPFLKMKENFAPIDTKPAFNATTVTEGGVSPPGSFRSSE